MDYENLMFFLFDCFSELPQVEALAVHCLCCSLCISSGIGGFANTGFTCDNWSSSVDRSCWCLAISFCVDQVKLLLWSPAPTPYVFEIYKWGHSLLISMLLYIYSICVYVSHGYISKSFLIEFLCFHASQ